MMGMVPRMIIRAMKLATVVALARLTTLKIFAEFNFPHSKRLGDVEEHYLISVFKHGATRLVDTHFYLIKAAQGFCFYS